MHANLRNQRKKAGGFTLMELLIVIGVLGLLLGLLIPRLGGVTDATVDTVCDSNNKGVRYFTQMFYNNEASLPDGLTAMVVNNGTSFSLPEPEDPSDNDAEVLAAEFVERNHPGIYALTSEEIDDLAALGITTAYVWQNGTRLMDKYAIDADFEGAGNGFPVMMMGLTAATNGADPSAVDSIFSATGAQVGNPEWIGRIMMPVNDKCDLVTKGYIQASALCPGAVLNEDNFTGKEYYIVLPRLQATVDRVNGVSGLPIAGAELTYSGEDDEGNTHTTIFTFEAQEVWQFDASCPEGHKWPDNDNDFFNYVSGDLT